MPANKGLDLWPAAIWLKEGRSGTLIGKIRPVVLAWLIIFLVNANGSGTRVPLAYCHRAMSRRGSGNLSASGELGAQRWVCFSFWGKVPLGQD